MALTAEVLTGSKFRASTFNSSSIPVVASPSDIAVPFTGQIVHSTSDGLLHRWTGAAWVGIAAVGGSTAATMHEARYHQIASAQSVSTATDTRVKFEQGITTCNDVTASGVGNNAFTLVRDGVWHLTAGIRLLGNAGGGERHLWIETGGGFVTANRIVGTAIANVGSAPVTLCCASTIRVIANTVITIGTFQNSGGPIAVDIGFGGTCHVALTWLRPL